MLQSKIAEAMTLLQDVAISDAKKTTETRLNEIQSKISDPDAMFSIDTSILKEVTDIVEKLRQQSSMIIEPPKQNMPLSLLKQILTSHVQSLCRLPVPLPQNFDKQAYQQFVNRDSKTWMERIASVQDESLLMDMFDEVYNTSFLVREVQQEFDELHKKVDIILNTKGGLTSTDIRLLNLIKLKVQARNIQQSAVASVIEHYMMEYSDAESKASGNALELSVKDTKILYHVAENEDIFVQVAKVIGLSNDEAQAIHKILCLDREKQKHLSKLTRSIRLAHIG